MEWRFQSSERVKTHSIKTVRWPKALLSKVLFLLLFIPPPPPPPPLSLVKWFDCLAAVPRESGHFRFPQNPNWGKTESTGLPVSLDFLAADGADYEASGSSVMCAHGHGISINLTRWVAFLPGCFSTMYILYLHVRRDSASSAVQRYKPEITVNWKRTSV